MSSVEVKSEKKSSGGVEFTTEFFTAIAAIIIFLGAGIGLIVHASMVVSEGHSLKLSKEAQAFDERVQQYLSEEAPQLNNWNVSAALGISLSRPLNLTTEDIHAGEFGNRKSTFFNGTFTTPTNGTSLIITVATPNNTFAVSEVVLTKYVSFDSPCDKENSDCTPAAKCVEQYGSSAVYDSSTNKCNALRQLNTNCLVVSQRKNDAGQDVWWKDFELNGCEYPFTVNYTVAYEIGAKMQVAVRTSGDPKIQLGVHAGPHNGELEIEVVDKKPKGIAYFLCGFMLVVGDIFTVLYVVKNKDKLLPEKSDESANDVEATGKNEPIENEDNELAPVEEKN